MPSAWEQVRALAREHSPEAFKTLVELMHQTEEPAVRLRAAEQILDRAFGRPVQGLELFGAIAHADVAAMSDVELLAHVTALRAQVEIDGHGRHSDGRAPDGEKEAPRNPPALPPGS